MAAQLRDSKTESANSIEGFQRELALAQRMANLYRETSEERGKKCNELEGVIQELRSHLQANLEAQKEALEKVEAARDAAEAELKNEKALRERMMSAAAAGNLGGLTAAGGQISSPGATPEAPPPMGGVSSAEMYAKYVEAHERWRQERLNSRKREIVMEELLVEVERRASLVKEQQTEYERLKAAHSRVAADLETVLADKRKLESDASRSKTELRNATREQKALDQQVQDLGQQVARLLYELQTLKSGAPAGAGQPDNGSFSGGNATDVTTQLLVEFSDVSELQQQNSRLLRVNRELSQQAEATKAEAEESLRQQYEEALSNLSKELDELRQSRQGAEEVLAQVVRQRDTLRQLLSTGGGDLASARAEYARSLGQEPGAPPRSPEPTDGGAAARAGVAAQRLHADLEEQFKQYKEEVNKNHDMLRQEVRK